MELHKTCTYCEEEAVDYCECCGADLCDEHCSGEFSDAQTCANEKDCEERLQAQDIQESA